MVILILFAVVWAMKPRSFRAENLNFVVAVGRSSRHGLVLAVAAHQGILEHQLGPRPQAQLNLYTLLASYISSDNYSVAPNHDAQLIGMIVVQSDALYSRASPALLLQLSTPLAQSHPSL